MGAAFLITLREGLEIALVLAILVSYLVKSERRSEVVHVWKGSGVAVGFCVVAGLLFHWFVGEFEGHGEHGRTVEGHPCGAVGLGKDMAFGQGFGSVEQADVIEAEEST